MFNIHVSLGNFGIAEGYGQKCINLEPKESIHKSDMDSFKTTKEKCAEAEKLFNDGNFKKTEELLTSILEKCSEYTDMKKLYIQTLLQNNKPKEVITFIQTKLNDDEKMIEEFDFYTGKALYFNGD